MISASEKDAQDVRVGLVVLVKLETRLDPPPVPTDEMIDLPVGIARNVLQRAATRGLLVQPMNRHDRKELIDRPMIRHGLKQREVTELPIDQRPFEIARDVRVLVRL